MEGQRRVGSLIWPLVLIGLGVVLLLNNLGMLTWSVWEMILRLWPVLIIGFGLELLIGRRSVWGSLLVALLIVAVLAGAVYLFNSPAATTGLTTEAVSQPLGDAKRGEVTIQFGVGRLIVDAGAAGDQLVEGTAVLGRGQRLISEGRVSAGVAYYRIDSEDTGTFWFPAQGADRRQWTLHLNPDVPLALTLRNGVGEATLDLADLQVADLDVTSGVGRVSIVLPSRGQVRVAVEGGVGEIVLTLPSSMAARIRVDAGLTQVDVPTGFIQEGDVYTSPGFDTAEDRVEIEIDGGIGRIVVEQQP